MAARMSREVVTCSASETLSVESAQHLLLAQRAGADLDLQLLENLVHAHRQRLVDDEAEGAARAVIANERHGLREVRIAHGRHRDQQLIGQI
jgi:hypothetical protein